ncbi:MAG: hypothetical protein ACYTHK_17500 [Planctomycetota bacterium]|jgi:hypothetical protein
MEAEVIGLLLVMTVELPLGPFARPGVPVLMTSEQPEEVDLAGWVWLVDGPTEVSPPQLPCALPGGSLQPAPERLVGVIGKADEGEVSIRLVKGMSWRPLDLFDEIRYGEVEPWEREILERWEKSRQGVPRTGNVLPEVYDLAPGRGVGSASMLLARLVGAAMGGAICILLLLGGRGSIAARPTLVFCGLIVLVGGGMGAWLTHRAAQPFSEARIVVHYPDRTRVFRMFRAEWDGAAMPAPRGVPFFYRGAGEPWWDGGDRVVRADEGIIRGFIVDGDATEPARTGDSEPTRLLRKLMRRHAPNGRWWWGKEAFSAGPDPVVPIVEIEAASVR